MIIAEYCGGERMKLLILSDVHSNLCALEAIWEREPDCDAVYCAGDLVDYGTSPGEVIRWFREHRVQAVFGNHDQNLVRIYEQYNGDVSGIAPEDYWWVHHNCSRLSREDIDYLKALPETLDFTADGYYYRMSHQFAPNYARPQTVHQFDTYVNSALPQRQDLPVRLIFGHTHRQAVCQFREGRLWMNPGSASYRRADDPDKTAHYAVIRDGVISLKAVEYSRLPLLRETLDLALSHRMARSELRLAFFFFGSAPSIPEDVEKSVREAMEQLL